MGETVKRIDNFIDGKLVPPVTGEYLDVVTPFSNEVCAKVAISKVEDVQRAVACAEKASVQWKALTVKARAKIMSKLYHLIQQQQQELAELISLENGKTIPEALAAVSKGNETVEWSCSVPQVIQGKTLQVSRGVTCAETLTPVGIVTCIVPFNFPIMVPLWTIPIALVCGNCVILKPSEKCPMTMNKLTALFSQAGVPPGVFQIVNGQKEAVQELVSHPSIDAVTFVGSSTVAEILYKQSTALCKRVLALGGAKNHLIALRDCDVEMTSTDVVSSFAGCAGQRCMAASVLLLVGHQPKLLEAIVEKAKQLIPGNGKGCMGPVIDQAAKARILKYISAAEESGAELLLDGRTASWLQHHDGKGNWVGPTIILHKNVDDSALKEEIFGPVLSVFITETREEAIAIENSSEYGNAACIYTTSGGEAEWFSTRFRAGMIGVNIGIPVPREPFSFGGLYGTRSKFGDHDITGEEVLKFFTNKQKITTKWTRFQTGRQEDISQFK